MAVLIQAGTLDVVVEEHVAERRSQRHDDLLRLSGIARGFAADEQQESAHAVGRGEHRVPGVILEMHAVAQAVVPRDHGGGQHVVRPLNSRMSIRVSMYS